MGSHCFARVMEKDDESGGAKFHNFLRVNPRDLLTSRGFVSNGGELHNEEDGEIELSLGLSLNGRFGVDPQRKRLKRSSSTISNMAFTHQTGGVASESLAPPSLVRASSLPKETAEEVEVLRRKELQSMRRMEARKKRMDKLKNHVRDSVSPPNGFETGNGLPFPSPQESNIESFSISGSSGISETQSQHKIDGGAKQNGEVKSPSSSIQYSGGGANAMLHMPYVSTKWDGENGIKIDGLLYRYKNGEEVRIICLCHGFFLSPAEFVEHGGHGDVENPLKHIVVNPSPLL